MVIELNGSPLLQANRAVVTALAVANKLALAEAGLVAVQGRELSAVLTLARLG